MQGALPKIYYTRKKKYTKESQISDKKECHTFKPRVSEEMIPRVVIFDFVGNLPRSSLQAKIDTFRETCLCQIKSATDSTLEFLRS